MIYGILNKGTAILFCAFISLNVSHSLLSVLNNPSKESDIGNESLKKETEVSIKFKIIEGKTTKMVYQGNKKGDYFPSESPNKNYVIAAAKLALKEPNKKYSKSELWKKATEGYRDAAKIKMVRWMLFCP
ncbi:hypothetical protein B4923_13740 [Brenneria roseae subsp. americana]|uniref:Uncharacterized protein n=1 Tax=Brenneria roseae subsp. americana TaxID=1508507 RepID=A0A2U1TPQ0_9GAMM|nr:hypothetical protein [Brenneria roseae]PWC11386.1 hypothetical protein B4923_13740 [Brenneria roseae subsp. americana]